MDRICRILTCCITLLCRLHLQRANALQNSARSYCASDMQGVYYPVIVTRWLIARELGSTCRIWRMLIWTIMIMESRRRKSSCAFTSIPLLEFSSGSAHVASQSTIAAVNLEGRAAVMGLCQDTPSIDTIHPQMLVVMW